MNKRRFILLLALIFVTGQLHAQVKVDLTIKRDLYIVYEPILASIAITNYSGHDLTLSDADGQKWFGFQITTKDERVVPPLDLNYRLAPLVIPAGQTVKRSVNLTSLYAVQEFGPYRIRASVYSSETKKYYSSNSEVLQVTEGRIFWQQTLGVPGAADGAGGNRTVSLILFRQPKENVLYVRVEDKDGGIVYTTSPLGRIMTGYDATVEIDRNNQVHVLQLIGAKSYVYTVVGLNGQLSDQLTYNAVASRPVLKKNAAGDVIVSGGQVDQPVSPNAPAGPKVSERPAGFPQL